MSKFLAPIHLWLFNKILILENIEKEIINTFDFEELQNKHDEFLKNIGDFIPDKPIEDLIDQSNIHGWLQNKITVAEIRQSALIKFMMDMQYDIDKVKDVYYHEGKRIASLRTGDFKSPMDIFNELGNVLLEGMPCDRVNNILESNENEVVWEITHCVHKKNWEKSGVDVDYYYTFREFFIKGFVENINKEYKYDYDNGYQQLCKIVRK